MLDPFWIALQFLTRLPVPAQPAYEPAALGRSVVVHPLVGLLIGALLAATGGLLAAGPPLVAAALALVVWVLASGALHLDGLADSADAWLGGRGDRERTLELMRDARNGTGAVVAVALVLLVKLAALAALVGHGWAALLLAPALGRGAGLALLATTAYVRPDGLGAALVERLPRRAAAAALAAVAVLTVLLLGWTGLAVLAVTAGVFAGLRALMRARIGGTTGDTAGALIELTEAAALVVAALGHA